jgi:pectate lyase
MMMTEAVMPIPVRIPAWVGWITSALLGLGALFTVITSNTFEVDVADPPAFPGCEGFGCESVGGRGGDVCIVTNTNSTGAGSLWECMNDTSARIVIFRVSGVIALNSSPQNVLLLANSDLTILGQTAPGDGIMIEAASTDNILEFGQRSSVAAHDVIIQHIRFRKAVGNGPESGTNGGRDAIDFFGGSYNIVLDHCDVMWTSDEAMDIFLSDPGDSNREDIHDITWSRMIMGEHGRPQELNPLGVGYAVYNISIHHNLFIHSRSRNPHFRMSDGTNNITRGIHFINNVHYNTNENHYFQTGGTSAGDPDGAFAYPQTNSMVVDVIGSYMKAGPQWGSASSSGAPMQIHEYNNYTKPNDAFNLHFVDSTWRNIDGTSHANNDEADNYNMIFQKTTWVGLSSFTERTSPISTQPTFPITIQTFQNAYNSVVVSEDVGAKPHDSHAARLVDDPEDQDAYDVDLLPSPWGSGTYSFSTSGVPTDTDSDGLPDTYETLIGTDPNVFENHAVLDADGDGWANIEDWAHSLTSNPTPGD